MKTLKRCFFILVCIAFAGVIFLVTRRPHIPPPNPEDLWICNEFDISFVGFDEEKGGPVGQVTVNGEVTEVAICIGPGPRFEICSYPLDTFNDVLVRGSCYFSKDKGTVHIKEDKAGILDGAKTITFLRQRQ